MEEKKLTDKEIIKAMEICANWNSMSNCKDCPIGLDACCENQNGFAKYALDLIHRLQANNAELQKQVDELTEKLGKVLLGIKADEVLVAKGVEQAVKDTAKEILEKLWSYMGSNQKFWIVNEEHITILDCDKLWNFTDEIRKNYGVEMEYGVEVE